MTVAEVKYGAAVAMTNRVEGQDDRGDPAWLMLTILKVISKSKKDFADTKRYLEGDPPKPETPNNLKEAWVEFETFRKKSRTNFAGLIVAACVDRTTINGFRTAAKGDEDGDLVAEELWDENDMAVKADALHKDVFGYGAGFLLADPNTKRAHHFRPWQAKVIPDVNGDSVVGVNLRHDPMEHRDYAQLWIRDVDENGAGTGTVTCHTAVRDRTNKELEGVFNTEVPLGTYISRNWVWWKTTTTELEILPLVEFDNRDGIGEFDQHTDVLDRINLMILQRVVIIIMQAFRQRAIKGSLPTHDEKGQRIDYDELFPASPGALWLLGPDAEMWESATTDVTSILASVKDDVRDLAAVTRTPMTYFSPDSAGQSAEGASLQNEGYTSKIEDRKARLSGRWRAFMSLMFQIRGDAQRAEIKDLEVLWTPTSVTSLTEKYSAAAQGRGLGLSLKTIMREVLTYTPRQMRAADLERISEILTAALTNGGAGAAGQQTPLQEMKSKESAPQRVRSKAA